LDGDCCCGGAEKRRSGGESRASRRTTTTSLLPRSPSFLLSNFARVGKHHGDNRADPDSTGLEVYQVRSRTHITCIQRLTRHTGSLLTRRLASFVTSYRRFPGLSKLRQSMHILGSRHGNHSVDLPKSNNPRVDGIALDRPSTTQYDTSPLNPRQLDVPRIHHHAPLPLLHDRRAELPLHPSYDPILQAAPSLELQAGMDLVVVGLEAHDTCPTLLPPLRRLSTMFLRP
jgi:hypothetical protein